jgi:hypothetical protein
MSNRTYENKAVRLYYEIPEDYKEVLRMCDELKINVEHWQDGRRLLKSSIENTLSKINITTVPHDGGWQ